MKVNGEYQFEGPDLLINTQKVLLLFEALTWELFLNTRDLNMQSSEKTCN